MLHGRDPTPQHPNMVVRSNATFADGRTFLAAAREGGPETTRFNMQDAFRMVDLLDDDSDFSSDFDLKSEEHTEVSTDEVPKGDTNMGAYQASSEGNLEAIVVGGLQIEDVASVGLFHSREVIKLYNQMNASVTGYDRSQILEFLMEEFVHLRFA